MLDEPSNHCSGRRKHGHRTAITRWPSSSAARSAGRVPLEGGEQVALSAVAEAHPHEYAGGSGPVGQMEEVFIFADQSAAVGDGVIPDVQVVGFVHL